MSKIYVLDTSVLLSDPRAFTKFDEHHVVVPIVVLTELEGKRHHPELGWAARTALRALEDYRTKHGSLLTPFPVGDLGGQLSVEMNHQDTSGLPSALRDDSNDFRILTVAHNFQNEGHEVVLVSKDLPLRLRASVAGIEAEEYRNEQVPADPWSGLTTLTVPSELIDSLYAGATITTAEVPGGEGCHPNAGLVLQAGSQSAVTRIGPDGTVRLLDSSLSAFGLKPRSVEQRVAMDLLMDNDVGIVSVTGNAGTGKSLIALAAALELVMEAKTHRRVVVFRPMQAVGGEELGFLPGSVDEKVAPWAMAIHDALDALDPGGNVKDEVLARGIVDIQPITYIRGRTLGPDVIVIISEAQSWEAASLGALLTRLGERSRAFIDWDVNQRDSLRVGRYDGIVALVNRLRGNPLFGHVALRRQERSPVAELAAQFLEDSVSG